MLNQFFRDDAAVQRLHANPLGSRVDSFAAWLSDRGYAWTSIRERLWTITRFGKWLKRRGLGVHDLRRSMTEAVLCRRSRASHLRLRDAGILRLFFDYLEAAAIIPAAPPIDQSALDDLKARYETYLRHDRGLSPLTGRRHWFVLGPFLRERFGDGPIHVRDLSPDDITRYVLRQIPRRSPPSAQLDAWALRSFLRFLVQAGAIDRDLAAAIPPVRRWRLVEVPKYLKAADVARVLASCDRQSPIGRRDYALLLLLARLGLRAGEVVRLELDDLDWRTGRSGLPQHPWRHPQSRCRRTIGVPPREGGAASLSFAQFRRREQPSPRPQAPERALESGRSRRLDRALSSRC